MDIFCRNLREVDALVAEHLMNWTWVLYNPETHRGRLLIPKFDAEFLKYNDGSPQWLPATGEERLALDWIECGLVPHYTTGEEIGAVIQNREQNGYFISVADGRYYGTEDYECIFRNRSGLFSNLADSIPVAICLAALSTAGINARLKF